MNFGWDDLKADLNLKKHNVTFEEARTVFYDPLSKIGEDVQHSYAEFRDIIIGRSIKGRILIVSYAERNGKIRLINARETTKLERLDYEENIK